MAHFAEIDSENIVLRVIVLANETITDEDNKEQEQLGLDFIANHLKLPGTWKQTSYNNNFRKQYAGIGYVYNASKNKFLDPQPHASWSLNSSDDWEAPVTYPDDGKDYVWDEDVYNGDNTKGWVEIT